MRDQEKLYLRQNIQHGTALEDHGFLHQHSPDSRQRGRRQQSLMLSTTSKDERPFVLSAPRLDSDDSLHLHFAFDDPRVDRLFELKTEPNGFAEIKETLDRKVTA